MEKIDLENLIKKTNFKINFLHDEKIFFHQFFLTIWNLYILSIYHAPSVRGGPPGIQISALSFFVFLASTSNDDSSHLSRNVELIQVCQASL